MTREDFKILTYAKIQSIIEENIDCDPAEFALGHRNNDLPAALIASQLHSLQKSRSKLPSWYQHRCIFPPRAFEQASSEATAALKSFSGDRCLDLTAGLGVDSWHFSRHFRHVISLEQNPDLAAITAHNLAKLGVSHADITCTDAASYLRDYDGPPFDLIYLDPDRRDASGQRKIRIEDCSPNVFELLPLLHQHGNRILIKLSPLFDLTEARRAFPQASRFFVVSVNNECKELLIELGKTTSPPQTEIRLSRNGVVQYFVFEATETAREFEAGIPNAEPAFVLEPDVAFYKAGLGPQLLQKYFPELGGAFSHWDGYYFSPIPAPADFPGRCFRIRSSMPYKPGPLKKWLKQTGVKQLNVIKRHFPSSTAAIRKQLGITEGGEDFLICTRLADHSLRAYWAERC